MTLTSSYICLQEMKFFARHGVLQQEQITGNTYLVDLRLKVNFSKALHTDELEYTLNYAEVYEALKAEMAIPSQLIEHVAGRIAERLFSDFSVIEAIDLILQKKNPPMGGDLHAAAVEIHCTR